MADNYVIFGRAHTDVWPVVVCTSAVSAANMVNALHQAVEDVWEEALRSGLKPSEDEISISNKLDPNAHSGYYRMDDGSRAPDITYEVHVVAADDNPGTLMLRDRRTIPHDESGYHDFTRMVDVD